MAFRGRWWRSLIVGIVCAFCTMSGSAQVHFRLEPRSLIEKRLKSFRSDNRERERLIRKLFAESGCAKANLIDQPLEQPVEPDLPPNIICVLPGETKETIIVGAHTDKVSGSTQIDRKSTRL